MRADTLAIWQYRVLVRLSNLDRFPRFKLLTLSLLVHSAGVSLHDRTIRG